MLNMLYGEPNLGISLDVSSYMTATGLSIGDRTDVAFMLKSSPTALDADAEYSIVEGANLVVSGNVITAKISDWTDIVAGTIYYPAFGIKMTGEDDYREMPLKAISREIKFRQDVMRK